MLATLLQFSFLLIVALCNLGLGFVLARQLRFASTSRGTFFKSTSRGDSPVATTTPVAAVPEESRERSRDPIEPQSASPEIDSLDDI